MTKDLTAILEVLGLSEDIVNTESESITEVEEVTDIETVNQDVPAVDSKKDTGKMVHHRWMEPREPKQAAPKRSAPINIIERQRVKDTLPSSNPATLTFPTDRYGMTTDLKKSFTAMVSRIAGDPAKKKLADDTLDVLLQHLDIRFKSDVAYKIKLAERDRLNREQNDA